MEEDNQKNLSLGTEFPDEDHSVLCEWWYKDKKYGRWFDPNDLRVVIVTLLLC